jgi:hypothetical protein
MIAGFSGSLAEQDSSTDSRLPDDADEPMPVVEAVKSLALPLPEGFEKHIHNRTCG